MKPKDLEKLLSEREDLIQEKKRVEFKLSQVEDYKKLETAKIIKMRLGKNKSIEKTAYLEAEIVERKQPLLKDKTYVEQRLHEVKYKLRGHEGQQSTNMVEVLCRIENAVLYIADLMEERNDRDSD